jgi:alanyl-tRNA synthetase
MTEEEIQEINRIVNERVRQNLKVYDEEVPYKKAIEEGAIALFDEKYADKVRVMKIGKPFISAELCGGTHITSTGEIGFFYILGESSIGAGLRRIEAVTGRGAEKVMERFSAEWQEKISSTASALDTERRRVQALERELSKKVAESLLSQTEVINGVKVLVAKVPPSRMEILREMSDQLREQLGSVVVVLGTVYEDKPAFLAAVTQDLVDRGYNAGEIVKQVARVAGGGGGGKASLAQAGGKYKDKLDEALRLVRSLI